MTHKVNIQITLEIPSSYFEIDDYDITTNLAQLIAKQECDLLFPVADLHDDSRILPSRIIVEAYASKAIIELVHGRLEYVETLSEGDDDDA